MFSRLRAHLPLWRRALRRRRRLLAVLALAALTASLLPSLLPPSSRGVEIVVADAELTPGTALSRADLRTARIAPELLPEGAAQQIEDVVGQTARLPIEPGTPLLPGLLEDPAAPALPSGSALMAVPVPRALVAHLQPGTELMLLVTDPSQPSGTAVSAQVVDVVVPENGESTLGGGSAATAEVLVAVEAARAGEVANALGLGVVTVSVITP